MLDGSLRTTLAKVFAAGDCAGVTAAKSRDPAIAAAEGRHAGWHAAASLGSTARPAPSPPPPPAGTGAWMLPAWARAIGSTAPDDLVVCQCEEVTRGDLLGLRPPRYLAAPAGTRGMDALRTDGPLSQDQVKRLTRAGMGHCQGRRCRDQVAAAWLAGTDAADVPPLPTYRPPLRPLPLSVLRDTEEAAAMLEHWESWFGMPSQWLPPWQIAEARGGRR